MSNTRWPTRTQAVNMEALQLGHAAKPKALARLGYSGFRGKQEDVVNNVLAHRDTIVIFPTSAGKTATFVIPALCLGWRTLVISPLLALMRDQTQSLQRKGISAAEVNSSQTMPMNTMIMEQWAAGRLQFMYVSPERLMNEEFKRAIARTPPDFLVLDEAHTLAQWGDTFRHGYKILGDFIRDQNPRVVLAATATCPPDVEEKIRDVLGLKNALKVFDESPRDNLNLRSEDWQDDLHFLQFVARQTRGSTIVYCATVKHVEELFAKAVDLEGPTVATMYHGKLNQNMKKTNFDDFMSGRRRIVFATNAFGMGIDKPDVRWVVHRDIPKTPEALAQEVGRAGRDGLRSDCVLFYDKDSLRIARFLNEQENPAQKDIERVFRQLTMMKDSFNIVRAGEDEIFQVSGAGSSWRAIMQVLRGDRVVKTHDGTKDKLCEVRLKTDVPELPPSFIKFREALMDIGYRSAGNAYSFPDAQLATQLGIELSTLKSRLTTWRSSGFIEFTPPPRYKPIEVIGDLSNVNFKALADRKRDAELKLMEVVKYAREVPDSEKAAFLSAYMTTG